MVGSVPPSLHPRSATIPERDVRQEYVRQQSPVQARRFALLLITILLRQSALPGAPPATKVAAAATMAEPASSANGVPHATGRNAPLTQSEDHEPGVVVEPPPESDVAPFVAALPVPLFLRLESDQAILHPGERAQLTIHAWRATDEVLDELPLTLTLPPGLTLVDSTTPVTWPMATVTEGTIFSRTIAIEPADGNSFATAVVQVTLQTAAAERFSAYQVETVLGIDNRGAQPSGQGVNRATLGEEGLILTTQQGDITLLVEPNRAEVATTFRYDNLYQWQSTELPTEPPTEQISITTTARLTATASISTAAALTSALSLFLPIVRTGGEAVDDAPTEDNAYLVEDEIRFVRQWRLDADYQGAQRSTFAQRVHILVDADWLIERGQKPSRFTLYTRADTKASWQRVTDVRYDEVQQRFWASTTHFSEYGLGLDNRVVGESLPDVAAFGNDLFTGAATYSYPIAVPTGAGGMAPALGLHYSSATVDTFRWANYKNELPRGYRVQAGLAGLGWNISALNHIAFTEEGDPHTASDNRYSLVLNGTSNTFLQGQRLTEDFARIEDNRGQSVARGKWIITTADGTSHYFGGTTTGLSQPDAHPYENVMIWNTGQYTQHNVENKWFLRKSVDPLGNYVAYTYDAVTRTLPTCGNGWYESNCARNALAMCNMRSTRNSISRRWKMAGVVRPSTTTPPSRSGLATLMAASNATRKPTAANSSPKPSMTGPRRTPMVNRRSIRKRKHKRHVVVAIGYTAPMNMAKGSIVSIRTNRLSSSVIHQRWLLLMRRTATWRSLITETTGFHGMVATASMRVSTRRKMPRSLPATRIHGWDTAIMKQ